MGWWVNREVSPEILKDDRVLKSNENQHSTLSANKKNDSAPKFTAKELENKYMSITKKAIKIQEETEFCINLAVNEDKKFVQEICETTLPTMKSIILVGVSEIKEEVVNDFLELSIPNNQLQLSFNFNLIWILEGSKYYSSLCKAASKIVEIFEVNNLHLSNSEFWGLLISASKWKNVKFLSWFIETDQLWNFATIKESKVKTLEFDGTGDILYSDWLQYPRRYRNIIHGIANNSPLKHSLFKLCINSWGINKSEAMKTIEYDKLEYIEVEWKSV